MTYLKKDNKNNHNCDNNNFFFVKYCRYIVFGFLFLVSGLIYYCHEQVSRIEQKKIHQEDIIFEHSKLNVKRLQYLAHEQFENFKTQFEDEYPLNSYDTTFVGDFTNDGLQDVALYYKLKPNQGDYRTEDGILLFENKGGGISFFLEYNPPYLFSIDQILNSRIILNRLEKNDYFVSPSVNKKVQLKIDIKKRTEVEIKQSSQFKKKIKKMIFMIFEAY